MDQQSLLDPLSCGFAVVAALELMQESGPTDAHNIFCQVFTVPLSYGSDKLRKNVTKIREQFQKWSRTCKDGEKAKYVDNFSMDKFTKNAGHTAFNCNKCTGDPQIKIVLQSRFQGQAQASAHQLKRAAEEGFTVPLKKKKPQQKPSPAQFDGCSEKTSLESTPPQFDGSVKTSLGSAAPQSLSKRTPRKAAKMIYADANKNFQLEHPVIELIAILAEMHGLVQEKVLLQSIREERKLQLKSTAVDLQYSYRVSIEKSREMQMLQTHEPKSEGM